jgi:formylglycine-generating enzyme required for sulfatase activity
LKRPVSVPADPAAPASPAPTRDVVFISSGPYSVGLDPSAAQFFNQTPRYEVELLGFSIDRLPSGDGRPLGLAFAEAQAHCQGLGFRLPSEEEWEVAAQVPGFEIQPGVFEWTASWYQAYPGNSRAEKEYGASYRVLRGTSDWSDESLYTRRFMEPTESNAQVGFRCLKEIE